MSFAKFLSENYGPDPQDDEEREYEQEVKGVKHSFVVIASHNRTLKEEVELYKGDLTCVNYVKQQMFKKAVDALKLDTDDKDISDGTIVFYSNSPDVALNINVHSNRRSVDHVSATLTIDENSVDVYLLEGDIEDYSESWLKSNAIDTSIEDTSSVDKLYRSLKLDSIFDAIEVDVDDWAEDE